MMRLIQIGYAAFWNSQLGEIPDDTNDDGAEIFIIPTEQDIKEAKQRRDEKRAKEQRQYETDMTKIKASKRPTFNEGKTVESARLLPYDFQAGILFTQIDKKPKERILRERGNENGTNANQFNLAANSINLHLNSEAGSHMLGAQVIARSDAANKDAIGITNLLFGIQQLGKARVKTKRFRQLTPSAILKQVMRSMLNQNENQALGQNQEIQIRRTHDDMPPPNSGPRDQPPPGHGLYTQRNAAIPQSTIFPPTLNAEQEIPGIQNVLTKETIKEYMRRWMLKGFDLIPVDKHDEEQYWPGFGPGVPHATDWRKTKQQGQTPSMDEVRAFWREYNFDLRVACVRREYDSEDDSETLQPAKITRQEFRNRFGRHRNRSLSPHNKRSKYDSPDRRSESRERSGSRGYSRSRDYEGPRETRTDANRNYNGFETRNESGGRGRGTYRGRGYSYQGRGQSYQDRDQSNQERYREAQKYNPYTKQAFNKKKNPIDWNKTHQYEDKIGGEGWDDNPNDDWIKRTQMQKDAPDNHSDRDSTWTEDEAPQLQVSTLQSKQPTQQTQRVQQKQIQPKQQAPAQIPKQKGKIGQPPNQDDIDEQEIMQERLAALQKEKEELDISDSDTEWQQVIGAIDNNNNLTP
ncbi:MAG: hypothetical protein EZS28_027111, partial [Streblomastix strix]